MTAASPILPITMSTATGIGNISSENIIAGVERLIDLTREIDPANDTLWSLAVTKIERKTGVIEIELHIGRLKDAAAPGAVIFERDVNLRDPYTHHLARRIFNRVRDNWNERWTLVEDPLKEGSLISKADLAKRELAIA